MTPKTNPSGSRYLKTRNKIKLHSMKTVFLFFLPLAFSFIATGCAQKKTEPELKKLCLTDQMIKSTTFDSVSFSAVEDELKLTGKVTFNEEKVIKVYPFVSGIVTDVKVGLGDRVQKGQVLAEIRSSEMAGFENDLNIAKSDYETALKNFSSVDDMYKSGIASGKEYTLSKDELDKAKSALDKAIAISSMYDETSKTYIVKAPLTGVIVTKDINPNMQLRADYSDVLFTISDLKNVWIMANIFESDISKVRQNFDVEVTTLSYPDKVIIGKVDKLSDVLDDVTKVMKARIKVDNSDYLLKPGMFANVTMHYKEDIIKPVISSKAVIFDNSKNYVIVYRDKCDFELREVKIYRAIAEKTYLDSGLKAGEKVIVNNSLLVYDEITD
jgi:cobalt-zinc-cadmium efflux system membrane fusion protein